jgi:hypothetical protein
LQKEESGYEEPMETRRGRAIVGLAILGFVGFVLFGVSGGVIGAGIGALIGYLSKRK